MFSRIGLGYGVSAFIMNFFSTKSWLPFSLPLVLIPFLLYVFGRPFLFVLVFSGLCLALDKLMDGCMGDDFNDHDAENVGLINSLQ